MWGEDVNKKNLLGWIYVGLAVLMSGFWAYWGAFENFHEGWYSESFFANVSMFIFQYMLISIMITLMTLTIMKWKKFGCVLCIIVGIAASAFLTGSLINVLGLIIAIFFTTISILGYLGDPQPMKQAKRVVVLVPLSIAIMISIPQYIKISQRIDTSSEEIAIVKGNSVTLAWAPKGPGWPEKGVSWNEARWICSHLSEDGSKIMDEEQNIWRLPTVDEAVRSMKLHNENVNGIWDEVNKKAVYTQKPDKEYPLWDKHSKVIYYWIDELSGQESDKGMIIVYNGSVYQRSKTIVMDSLSFRAVKDLE